MFVDESNAVITISVEVQYLIVVVVAIEGQENKLAPLLKVTCRHLDRGNGVKKQHQQIQLIETEDVE